MIYCDKKFVGNIIKQARIKSKLSQAELAEQIGLSEKHISNIERGLNFPALDTFLKLCEVFNLALDDFGLHINVNENVEKKKLLNQIFTASDTDIIAYNILIETFKHLICTYK